MKQFRSRSKRLYVLGQSADVTVVPSLSILSVKNEHIILALWLPKKYSKIVSEWYSRTGWKWSFCLWFLCCGVAVPAFFFECVPNIYLLFSIGCAVHYVIELQFLKIDLLAQLWYEIDVWLFYVYALIFTGALCDIFHWSYFVTCFGFCCVFLGLVTTINLDAHPVNVRDIIAKVGLPLGTASLIALITMMRNERAKGRTIEIFDVQVQNQSILVSTGLTMTAFLLKNIWLSWKDPCGTVMIKTRFRITESYKDVGLPISQENSSHYVRFEDSDPPYQAGVERKFESRKDEMETE